MVDSTHSQNLIRSQPGEAEDRRIAASTQRVAHAESLGEGGQADREAEELSLALAVSRAQFDSMDEDIDAVFGQETALALSAADAEQTSLELLRATEEGEVAAAMALSASSEVVDPDLAQALAVSMETDPVVDPELQHALALSKQSKRQGTTTPKPPCVPW